MDEAGSKDRQKQPRQPEAAVPAAKNPAPNARNSLNALDKDLDPDGQKTKAAERYVKPPTKA